MTFEEMRESIGYHMTLLPDHRTSHADAEDRASAFLKVQGELAEFILELETDLSGLYATGKMLYNQAISVADGKNADSRKAQSEADPEYNNNTKAKKELRAMSIYLKTHLSIFSDAHLFCRNIAKEK